jgi:hypothetical protein
MSMTREMIAKLTPAQRAEIAKHMMVPIRCGGTEYIDGKIHLRLGGYLVPGDVVDRGWPAIYEYQRTHETYVRV